MLLVRIEFLFLKKKLQRNKRIEKIKKNVQKQKLKKGKKKEKKDTHIGKEKKDTRIGKEKNENEKKNCVGFWSDLCRGMCCVTQDLCFTKAN